MTILGTLYENIVSIFNLTEQSLFRMFPFDVVVGTIFGICTIILTAKGVKTALGL